jgi:diguanylate cyclase (GGDEF)-like protein
MPALQSCAKYPIKISGQTNNQNLVWCALVSMKNNDRRIPHLPMSDTQGNLVQKVLLGSRIGYIEPAIRLIIGALILLIALGFFFLPSLNGLWLGLSIFLFVGLLGSGLTQFCMMAWTLRHIGFRSEWDELKALERAHTAEKTRAGFLETLNLLNEVIVEMTPDGRLTWTSDKWSELFGKDAGTEPGGGSMNFRRCISGDGLAKFDRMVNSLRENAEQQANIHFNVHGEKKEDRWVEGRFTLSRDADNRDVLRGVLRDITDSYVENLAIAHKATHDELTGLPKRTLLEDRMAQDKARADRNGTGLAVFFIDLDNFKQINDRLGHHAGDKVLIAVAKALAGGLRPSDTVARWGGDEFVALIPDLLTMDATRRVADNLLESARRKFSGTTAEIITFSIGVAVYPNDADSVSKLFVKADQALYLAKSLGRNNVQYASEPSGPLIWGA